MRLQGDFEENRFRSFQKLIGVVRFERTAVWPLFTRPIYTSNVDLGAITPGNPIIVGRDLGTSLAIA